MKNAFKHAKMPSNSFSRLKCQFVWT